MFPKIEVQVGSNTAEAEAGLDRVEAGMDAVAAKGKRVGGVLGGAAAPAASFGNNMKVSASHTANLTAQLNDVGVMLQAGQSPLILAMQQGTQITQVFQQMGGSGKDALRGIIGGLKGMVSPMAIVTIGTIAGVAALVNWARAANDARDSGSEFDDILEEINESLEEGEARIEAYRRGFENVKSLAVDDEIQRITEQIKTLDEAIKTVEEMGPGLTRSIARQQERLAGMNEERNLLIEKLDLLESQKRREEEAAAAYERNLRAREATVVTLQHTVSGLTNIVSLSQAMADNAWNARDGFAAALKEMAVANLAAEQSQLGRGNAGPGGPTTAAGRFEASTGGIFVERKKTSSRGGGGRSAYDERASRIEALVDSLKTEEETINEWREKSLETLQQAQDQELTILGGHAEAKLRIEKEYQERIQALRTGYQGNGLAQAQTFFGEMESAMENGTEKMLRIGKAFGAAEALINSYRAYTAVLADPTLPWFARIPAALGVLGAGIGMVNAIKGVNAGGSGGSAGGGGSVVGVSSQAEPAGAQRPLLSVSLHGEMFTRGQVNQLIGHINEAGDDGQEVVQLQGGRRR
jgi:uncharacterized membrane protein